MVIVTHPSRWRADYLGAGYSDGSSLIDTSVLVDARDGIWHPASFASLYFLRGDSWRFQESPWWLLSADLLGRDVEYCSLAETVAARLREGSLFVKLAKHKYSYFPAQVMSGCVFQSFLSASPILRRHDFIVSSVIDTVEECRNWIIDCEVRAQSVFARQGECWSGGPGLESDHLSEHARVALAAARELSLDVAVFDTVILQGGGVVIGEGNPPWCADFYTAPADVINEVVIRSQGRRIGGMLYEPDEAVRYSLRDRWFRNVPAK